MKHLQGKLSHEPNCSAADEAVQGKNEKIVQKLYFCYFANQSRELVELLWVCGQGGGVAVSGAYLAWRARWSAQPFVRTYGQWVNEYIIPIVGDFDRRAHLIEEEAYERLSANVDPETYNGDGSEFHEAAFNAGLSFYETMTSLHQASLNLFTAGLFHLLEQQLANLTYDASMETAVRDTQLQTVVEYYRDHLNLDFMHFADWNVMDEMRLVANVTKHGEGRSAEQLRQTRPELFQHPVLRADRTMPVEHFPIQLPLGGDGLYVTADDFRRYERIANALFEFVIEQFNLQDEQYFPR